MLQKFRILVVDIVFLILIIILQDSSVNRVSHGSITPGRECFRQGRANNGLTTKMNNGNIETGTSVGNGYNTKDLSVHTSLNIDKFSHSSKGPMRRYVSLLNSVSIFTFCMFNYNCTLEQS